MTAREKKILKDLQIGKEPEIVTNPYSKESVELCPEAVALYDFIRGCEISGHTDWFYMGRDVFIRNWPDEYTILLD